jgi:hypothetical protein
MRRMLPRLGVAALAVLGWLLSGAVHEVGHALVARTAGLRIVHMQPWALWGRAHIRFAGETTGSWYAAISASGMLLTVLVGIAGAAAVTLAARGHPAIRRVTWLFVPMMSQCLAWVGLPLAIAWGARAPTDDIAQFIQHTGWRPMTASLIGLCLAVLCASVLMGAFPRGAANQAPAVTTRKPGWTHCE